MFKFGFSTDSAEEHLEDPDVNKSTENKTTWIESKEIFCTVSSDLLEDIIENSEINTTVCMNLDIKHLSSVDVLNNLKIQEEKLSVLNAERNHSDLLTAVYEGGLKIWECTYDLLNYINDNKLDFSGKNVLDLGCGAGIIGILSVLRGSCCYFQDYNEEVLQYITIPNVKLNVDEYLNCKFYSGDWNSFVELVKPNFVDDSSKFNYIFTCETIYNTENYSKLHLVLKTLLKETGTIFLAAKSYYFGVGGGISSFQEFLQKEQTFEANSCWKCNEGVKREILEIKFRK